MSLVKLEGKNIVKKSTKRLNVILKKLEFNISNINKTYNILSNFDITPPKQLYNMWSSFTYSSRQLNKIIKEREISAKSLKTKK